MSSKVQKTNRFEDHNVDKLRVNVNVLVVHVLIKKRKVCIIYI
jgi:hypothetical protein